MIFIALKMLLGDRTKYAGLLFGITFTERPELVSYNPEGRVFEVADADGTPIGLFVGDFYTRPGKQGGAWMNNLVDQNHLLGQRPVVTNNSNLVKPPAGQPTPNPPSPRYADCQSPKPKPRASISPRAMSPTR